jgi:hypothetical protein
MLVTVHAISAIMGFRYTAAQHQVGKIIPSRPLACAINNTIWVTNSGMRACSCVQTPQKFFGNVLG